jgi:uncharacterized membrane protein
MKEMRKHYEQIPYSMATLVGGLVAILGVISFVAVLFRQ